MTNFRESIQLAPREREVLALLVAGMASKEVAWELKLTLETVLWYCKRIYKALNVHNRAAAVRVALEAGLVASASANRATPRKGAVSSSVRPLIGRADELAKLQRLLDHNRLVSLVGMGGVGKTSLGMEAARHRQDRYAEGVVDIRLDHVDDEPALIAALAGALEISLAQLDSDAWVALGTQASDRERLILLDNFEQLNDHAARLHELLAVAPKLSLLVTSRVPLGVPGETLLRVSGMACPSETDAHPEAFDAVALFVEEVQRRVPERSFSREELTAIGAICRQLGGMPLAILLAACWAEVLPIAQIVDQVADRPELLASDGIVPARHRRLDQVIDATLALRSADERAALARMSVFAGGFDRAAAAAVAGSSVETLAVLIRSSLLIYDAAADRYRMHPLVEERARAEAKRSDVWSETNAAHQAYYAALVGGLRISLLGTPIGVTQAEASRILDIEQANVRRAWYTALERDDAAAISEMVEPLVIWFDLHTRLAEGALLIRAALDSKACLPLRGMLQLFHGWLAAQGGAVSPETAHVSAALAQLEGSGAPAARVSAGKVAAALIRMVALARFEDAMQILSALESQPAPMPAYWHGRCLMLLSLLRSGIGDTKLALATADRMLDISLAAGELTGAHLAVVTAAWMALRLGELSAIPRYLDVGEQLMERLADQQNAAVAQAMRAVLALWRGDLDAASSFLEEAEWIAGSDNASVRSVTRGIMALHAGLEGRRVEAEAARAAIDVQAIEGLWPEVIAWGEWGLVLACARVADWPGAQTHLDRMAAIEDAPWCAMPEHAVLERIVAALRLAAEGNRSAARERLAAARAMGSRAHAMYGAWAPVLALA